MRLPNYTTLGGIHPETAAVKNILASHGVNAPHTELPFTEAMLLGIGGGLGSSYMLWEFEKHGYPSIVLAFRNLSNYTVRYLTQLSARLGASITEKETGGVRKAVENLETALADGHPVLTWTDFGGEPYYFHYLEVGVAVVYGREDDHYLVDNRAAKPYRVPADLMAEARAKVPSFKNRVMTINPPGDYDLETAIRAGLREHIAYLGGKSDSFNLPAVRKWARMLTDKKNKKGWPTVFKNGRGLFGTLRTIHEAVLYLSGGNLRSLFADFLDEAAGVLNPNDLSESADHYRALHDQWRTFADAALPENIDTFRETRDLLNRRESIRLEQGSDGLAEITPLNDRLHEIKGELNEDFPISETGTAALLAHLQNQLLQIYTAEKDALKTLVSP